MGYQPLGELSVGRLGSVRTEDRRPIYQPGATLYYTADGTFAKNDYPGLRAIRVEAQGAGGAGGGAGTTAGGQHSGGGGGGGGGYGRRFILVSDLELTESFTVGVGGAGVIGAAGGNGTDTEFGDGTSYVVRGRGGDGGAILTPNTTDQGQDGGAGGDGNGDLVIPGEDGGGYFASGGTLRSIAGSGGNSFLGHGHQDVMTSSSGSTDGSDGKGYGAGGSGAANGQNAEQKTGGDGADGILIVELYY